MKVDLSGCLIKLKIGVKGNWWGRSLKVLCLDVCAKFKAHQPSFARVHEEKINAENNRVDKVVNNSIIDQKKKK